ncbi:MAG: hypothetical protein ABL985_06675 [Casimicrobium sp.]
MNANKSLPSAIAAATNALPGAPITVHADGRVSASSAIASLTVGPVTDPAPRATLVLPPAVGRVLALAKEGDGAAVTFEEKRVVVKTRFGTSKYAYADAPVWPTKHIADQGVVFTLDPHAMQKLDQLIGFASPAEQIALRRGITLLPAHGAWAAAAISQTYLRVAKVADFAALDVPTMASAITMPTATAKALVRSMSQPTLTTGPRGFRAVEADVDFNGVVYEADKAVLARAIHEFGAEAACNVTLTSEAVADIAIALGVCAVADTLVTIDWATDELKLSCGAQGNETTLSLPYAASIPFTVRMVIGQVVDGLAILANKGGTLSFLNGNVVKFAATLASGYDYAVASVLKRATTTVAREDEEVTA